MKHIATESYKDIILNKHIENEDEIEKAYKEAKVKLTDERINYLTNKVKVCKKIEEK